jgi:single-stranded-DNA-specific exonuclease
VADALGALGRQGPIIVFSHFDADGLCSSAILTRALRQAGWIAEPMVIGKTGSPWEAETRDRLAVLVPAGLIVADLGTRAEPVLPGCPTLIIDHHVPTGEPQDAITISGNGLAPSRPQRCWPGGRQGLLATSRIFCGWQPLD